MRSTRRGDADSPPDAGLTQHDAQLSATSGDRAPPSAIERLAIGLVVGVFGFLTGLFAWWILSDAPGLGFGWRSYLHLSYALGIICFLLGLWRPHATVDVLGSIGQKLYGLWSQVLSWFQVLR